MKRPIRGTMGRVLLATIAAACCLLLPAATASAAPSPWWEVVTGARPTNLLSAGGSGGLVITLTNIGDAPLDATKVPLEILDDLPDGVQANGVRSAVGINGIFGPIDCEVLAGGTEVSCVFEKTLPPFESIELEVLVTAPGPLGAPGEVTVSGANAADAGASQEVEPSPDPTPFGIEHFASRAEEEGGAPATRAGSHPFQLTTTLQMNAGVYEVQDPQIGDSVAQPAQPRHLRFTLPVGMTGNISTLPKCSLADFYAQSEFADTVNRCPDATAIGAAAPLITLEPLGLLRVAVPVFNLPPAAGEPARFGFTVARVPVLITTEVDPDNQYRVIASLKNSPQIPKVLASTVTIWGTPGDPRHDTTRGWGCLYNLVDTGPCEPPTDLGEEAFLRLPVSCATAVETIFEAEPWSASLGGLDQATSSAPQMSGCNQVPFDPAITAAPTSKLAGAPSGLDFGLEMPNAGLLDSDATSEGQAKRVEVTLPEGMTVNPAQGEGLVGCSPAELARERFDSKPGEGCPEASKVGELKIQTPLISEEARGSVYVASPYDNPFNSLIALYMVARIPERGILVRQAGVVRPDPKTGQLTTVFDDLPQLPFTSVELNLRAGARSSLVTPPACGTYDVVARFTPWSASDPDNPTPGEIVPRSSSFGIEHGTDGGACPGAGAPPFKPGLSAGTTNNAAKSYSPFNLRLTRNDAEQEFTNFSIKLPPGVLAKLTGVGICPEAAIAAARARTGPTGAQEEIDSPSCPPSSQLGRTLAGSGVGASLTYVPGRVYLAGPFNGAKLSIVAITAAKVGPFDLGTVVIRLALRVDPVTAEVSVDPTASDPLPHIIQGIEVHLRDIRAYVDRPEFTFNPTNCRRTSTASTVLGSGLDFASATDDEPVTVTSPFQAAECSSLAFKPKLSLKLLGGTRRGATPRLKAVLKARPGDANIGKAQVTLPHSAFFEQGHIRTVCTRVQFAAGAGNGEQCPKGSVYGKATAITPLLDEPLSGPVFLRSSDNELPDLVAALHSSKADINLVGRIDSLNGRIRNTFEAVPDAPVTKFVLEMQGGKKGLIVNSTDICRGKHRAVANFDGQNGRFADSKPLVGAKCGGKK
ncbi:MAG TPA: hypothetical protein VF125_00040 [Solirubrobacterales bacterium]